MTEGEEQKYPAGWYDDPDGGGGQRYYDGEQWTESRSPPPPPPPPPAPGTVATAAPTAAPGEKEQNATGIIITGYVFAALMPVVGFIIGLTQINRNRHGVWVVVTSVAAFVVWLAIFSSSGNNY